MTLLSARTALSPRRCLVAIAALVTACSGGSSDTKPDASAQATPDASHPSRDAHADGRVAHHADGGTPSKDAGAGADVFVPSRKPGDRTPLSAACDPVDGLRCSLPWPDNTYTVKDPTTATGLRVHVSQEALIASDSPASINRADGFSRVSPIETAFTGVIDTASLAAPAVGATTGPVRLLVEQPGPTFGQAVPLRFDTLPSSDGVHSLLVAYPKEPLAPGTDYAVVVMNTVTVNGGQALTPDRDAAVALGLAPPSTSYEGALYAYDSPARQAMAAAGVDAKQAIRVWDFTTRSLNDATTDVTTIHAAELAAWSATPLGKPGDVPDAGGLRDGGEGDAWSGDANTFPGASDAGAGIGIVIDHVSTGVDGSVLASVIGHVTGIPFFLTASGAMNRDASGAPAPTGVHDVPFRVAIPTGTGDYRVVIYGHGTGGTYYESTFDQEITQNGAAKVGTQFIGWTASTILDTFGVLDDIVAGTDIAASGLSQSLADSMLVEDALGGSLGALLGGKVIGGVLNPAVGRHPDVNQPVWAGGSLGGTMGFVYSAANPDIAAAVLNVPGAAWTQFVVYSELFAYVQVIMKFHYPDPIDQWIGVAMGQLNFDPVDGAIWQDAVGDHHALLLEQESMGDPVLPNIGNDMVAVASHADQIGVVLNPIVTCVDVPQVTGHSGMTQFKVPKNVTADLSIHGFAAGSSPAGVAAQQQIIAFIGSVWAGAPTIGVPPECQTNVPANSCDFTNDVGD